MNKSLPVFTTKNEIVEAVRNYDTVILTAETGSGKSTQVPQYLFEAGYEVIVTQPRRIACITLADRVAEEMELQSNIVGYHTAFESNRTTETKILFCTDGLQMAKGIKDTENTILVLDEVHEWNLNIETLVAWIKKFRKDGNRIKVVLMSATVESQDLKDFYGRDVCCIDIPGRNYEVLMLEERYSNVNAQIMKYAEKGKNCLVFVEGKKEIDEVIKDIEDNKLDVIALPLHGELSAAEQNKCFRHYNKTKVVVATNIAQTSVTIPDIDVVIDNGKEKRIEVDDGIEGLFVHNISRADCKQRAGRAGRTKDGIYVLVGSPMEYRDEYSTPEIQRLVLDKVVLKLASVNISAKDLEFFHQPSRESLDESYSTLRMLEALDKHENITELGKRLIKMPVNVRFAKMIIEAEKYGCVQKMIKGVAILEIGTLVNNKAVTTGFMGWETNVSYRQFTKENKSDVLAEIDIYDQIINFKHPDLKAAGLNKKTFFRVKEMVNKLEQVLDGVVDMQDEEVDKYDFIKCIIAGIPDKLFVKSWQDYEMINSRVRHKLSNNSCLSYPRFVYGISRTITFKNRWGIDDSLTLCTMASEVTKEQLLELVQDSEDFTKDYQFSSGQYLFQTKQFIVPYESYYYNTRIDQGQIVVDEEHELWDECMKRMEYLVEEENMKYILINGKPYEINERWSGEAYIELSDHSVLNCGDEIKTLTTHRGKQIKFYCSNHSNYNLQILKKAVLDDYIRMSIREAENRIPSGKTGSLKIVADEYLGKLGKIDVSVRDYGVYVENYIWCGLEIDKNSVAFKAFKDEDSMVKSTNEALQMLVGRQIHEKYNDKNFIIKRDGKKIETKKTIEAKDYFHEMSREILAETNMENFAEQVQFLDEIYNESIQMFTAS